MILSSLNLAAQLSLLTLQLPTPKPINMAETLLFSLADSFIGKLASRAVEEASLAMGVYDDLREIKDTVALIKAVLSDAEQKQQQNNELREWLRQIKRAFHNAEDIIDDLECETLRRHAVNTSGSNRRKVRRFFSSSNPLVYRLRMAHRIRDIKQRLDKVAADRHKFGLQTNNSGNRVVHRQELTHSHVIDSDVIGREHDKQNIIDLLLQDDDGHKNKSHLSVIPIVGIGGMGKTTLAKSVFNDKRIVESFPLKMWACVSDDFEFKNLLTKILNSASLTPAPTRQEDFKDFNEEQLQNRLRNTLAGQKFLLVLDDVWNEDLAKWVELRNLLRAGADGSKVLVTTRNHSIANMMGTHTDASYTLQGLSREDSLSVFVKWAFKEGEEKKHPELMEIGENIVHKCGGLPLALRTLGSLLFLKVDIHEWKFVRDSEIWNLPQKKDDILPALKLSYDQLPSYLKPCFACFSLFEKDSDFNNFIVVMLWEALDFLPSSPNKGKTLEDIGNQFLHELRSRSFLQDFVDLGSHCEFKLHDLVHDLALYIARDEFQLLNSPGVNISENVLHLSFTKNDLLDQSSIPTCLRTILFARGASNEAVLNTVVSRCKYLRVLQLSGSRYGSLPRSIGKLKHLRDLNLVGNKELERLPDSVCELQNLHSLLLCGCTNLQTLPNGMGNLISLRLLHITTKQSSFPGKEIAKLTSLEHLSLESSDNLESLFEGIQLHSLKLLRIESCENLKSLSLHAIPNLESLLISDCDELKLSVDHDNQIPTLRLKVLHLDSLPQLVTFPQLLQGCANTLQSFKVDDCDNLEELPKWLSTAISLKTLQIEDCPKLLSLPDDVHCLPNLEYLEMKGCPELCRRYQRGVGQEWPKISHIKQVIIESSARPKKKNH